MAAENPNGEEKYQVNAEPVKLLNSSVLDGGEKYQVNAEPVQFLFPAGTPVTTFTKGNFFLIGF
jgi:hypothetical protein